MTSGKKQVGGVRSQSSAPRSAFSVRVAGTEKRQWQVIHDSESAARIEARQMADAMQCPTYVMDVKFKDGSRHFSVIDDEVWLMCGKHSRGVLLGTYLPSEGNDG